MKKQTFFLTSLSLALAALGLQIVGWYCLSASAASAVLKLSLLPILPASALDNPQDWDVFRALIWIGLALALLSLLCVTASFRRRKAGWRSIPATMLTLYLATWVYLSLNSGL
jgi:hypothetical protein